VIPPSNSPDLPCRSSTVHLSDDELSELTSTSHRRPGSFRERRLTRLCRHIDELLIRPLAEHLNGVRCGRAVVVLPTAFSVLPLEAYVAEAEPIDGLQHVVLMPAFMFGNELTVSPLPRADARILVVGYSGDDLPGAEEEAAGICALFGDRSTYLAGQECTKRNVIEALCGEFDYVHLICHGDYDTRAPLNSSLYFHRPPTRDAFTLRAAEIQRYVRFAREPVVSISACSTALVADSRTNTWDGLPGSLLRAGARALIAARWPVDDWAASDLMRQYYGTLATCAKSAVDAFFMAQDSLRRSRRKIEDWACFGYLGVP
jgi:CHAT domain-containing protein